MNCSARLLNNNALILYEEFIMAQQGTGYGVRIGDVTIRLTSKDVPLEPHAFYKAFLIKEPQPDIDIQVHYGDIPDIRPEQKVFDSGGVWKLDKWQGKYLFTFTSPVAGPRPYKIAIFTPDFTRGEIYLRPLGDSDQFGEIDPLEYPLDELLMINYLSQERGIDIHACGVALGSIGLAFTGVSGAGKSTIANLWKSRNVKVLSDDRLILRKQEECFWVYGTPWHGDARASLPDKVPLKGLYFLKQAGDNRIVPLNPTDATTRLIVRCFPTFYHVLGMKYTLGFVAELTQAVPCYELQFTPDQRAIDEVLSHV